MMSILVFCANYKTQIRTQWKNISEHFYRMIQEYISNLIMLTYWILDMSPFNVFSQSALSGKGHVTE